MVWWVWEFNSFNFSFLLWKSTRSNSQRRKGWSSCVEMPPQAARRGTDCYSSQPTWLPWLEISIDYGMFRIAANSICTLFAAGRIWGTNLAIIWKNTMMSEWRSSLSNPPGVCSRIPGDHMHQPDMIRKQLAPCYRHDASAWEWRHKLYMGDCISYGRPWAKMTHITPCPSDKWHYFWLVAIGLQIFHVKCPFTLRKYYNG